MATYTTYTDGSDVAAKSGGKYDGSPARTVLEGVFDSSKRNLVAADVVTIVNIPAGMVVEQVGYEIVTAEVTAAQTFSLGDGGSTAGWVSGASSSAVAGTRGIGAGARVAAGGYLYAAADTIDLLVPATMVCTTFKLRVFVIGTIIG